jgi:hypothetical protein
VHVPAGWLVGGSPGSQTPTSGHGKWQRGAFLAGSLPWLIVVGSTPTTAAT